jgi:hypothetical protein
LLSFQSPTILHTCRMLVKHGKIYSAILFLNKTECIHIG